MPHNLPTTMIHIRPPVINTKSRSPTVGLTKVMAASSQSKPTSSSSSSSSSGKYNSSSHTSSSSSTSHTTSMMKQIKQMTGKFLLQLKSSSQSQQPRKQQTQQHQRPTNTMKILVPSKHGNSISVTFAKINSKSKSRQCPRPTVAAISPFPTTTTKSNKKSIGGISASSSSDPKARARNTLTLARRKLGKQLNSITIQEMHDILENRARLGLVDQISVGVYANTLESEMANSDSLSDISGETMVSSSCSGYSNSGSSGNSNSKTLTISSSKGYDGVVEELLEDMFDLCWPLDPIEKSRSTIEIRSSTPHGVVPPRFCGTSLRPLAAEQLMMKRGKIVCPLKNRLSKLNPHRAEFDSVLVERNEILGFRPQKSRLFHEIK